LKIAGGRFASPTIGLDVESQLLTFGEATHSRTFHGRHVNKHVGAAIVLNDKAEALLRIEELHGTCSHFNLLKNAPRRPRGAAQPLCGAAIRIRHVLGEGPSGQVARQAPYVINAATPRAYTVTVPGGPVRLGDQVNERLRRLSATLRWAGVVVGALLVAMISAIVAARRLRADLPGEPEPGRSHAAKRHRRTAHVLAEAAAGGLLGGLAGAGLGVALVVGVAAAMHWAPVIAPATVLPAPLAGLAAAACGALAAAVGASWAVRARR